MKTAEEIYMQVQDAECPNANNLTLPEDWQLNAMKEYARQCCEELRERIVNKARVSKITTEDGCDYIANEDSIRDVEINLP